MLNIQRCNKSVLDGTTSGKHGTSSAQPLLSEIHNFQRFKGRYYLAGFLQKIDKQGERFVELSLSDSSDTAKVYCRDNSCIEGDLTPESFVNIEARLDESGIAPYFRLKLVTPSEDNRPLTLKQLPVARCSHPLVLSDFVELIESINNNYLKQFVENVFCLKDIGIRFIQCPGSLNHHHNYHSGLLVHSVEVAVAAANRSTSRLERDLAIVAGLLHDVGKTLTLTPDLTRADIGYMVSHDQLTLEICSGALTILQTQSASLALQLRHIWTCETATAKHSFKAKTKVARLLKRADGMSAFGQ